ncbi:hypothetical protein M431DRAFT_262711 [Trichoderma harzianum CBS 226.95]|uniref:Uncharacterized protein n=1 Tax=Trichoderma harzianum CBS 226.95 TaxID=983964 RepID=A0A2T3ZZF5_TRIHA|nr:hypothetical protein M431DRAFT_262711 [Trichoderma harzianum CBS 226.95]PTB50190.1 hypothetical protein M431DRAFT_262711 [Trichoderma harzianum CBS 226.95]
MCLISGVVGLKLVATEGIHNKKIKTYNSRCSLMVTHLTTNLPVRGLSMGEQTGPRILLYLWSYVLVEA